MRELLFLSHRIPYPPDKGDKIRAWNIFRYLARTHRIHLGCFIDDPVDRQHLATLAAHCADLACLRLDPRTQRLKTLLRMRPGQPLSLGYFQDRRLQRWVDAKLAGGTIDSVYVFSSAMAGYVMHAKSVRRVLDMVDVDSEKWTAYAETAHFPARSIWAREGRTLLAFERLAAARFDHSLFVSEHEWQRFVSLAPETIAAHELDLQRRRFRPLLAGAQLRSAVRERRCGTGVHRPHGLSAKHRRGPVVRA